MRSNKSRVSRESSEERALNLCLEDELVTRASFYELTEDIQESGSEAWGWGKRTGGHLDQCINSFKSSDSTLQSCSLKILVIGRKLMLTKPEKSGNLKVDLNRSSCFILAELLIPICLKESLGRFDFIG